ncbi:MAG: M14 family metallopeptidase [Gammaproteobacteria bacterium]
MNAVYPIETDLPDLRTHAEGNAGVPYVHSFQSDRAGPHVLVNALTHGNEYCGAIVLKELLDLGVRPRRGTLTLSFANVAAFHRFDRQSPDASRFIDQDFNRVWSPTILEDATRTSIELRRARELRPVIDAADLLLDLHSMHERSAPLLLSGPLEKGIAWARELAVPPTIISDVGHSEGRRMRDYESFGDPSSPKNALLVECGQHWEARAVVVARDCTARFLMLAGVLQQEDFPRGWLQPRVTPPRVIQVTDAVVASSLGFRFAGSFVGLETFPRAGTVVGWNDGTPVVTPYDDCVLVMPSLRQLRPGVTVARFGRQIA